MDKELNAGLMERSIRGAGKRIKPVVRENSHMRMGTPIKDNGLTIRPMALGFILTLKLTRDMRATGKMI